MHPEPSAADERSAGGGRSPVAARLAVGAAVVAISLAIAALVKAGGEVMRSQGEQTAITEDQYRAIRVGDVTRRQLEQRFGDPLSMPSAVSRSCDYYLQHGRHATVFSFCFDAAGTVTSKGMGTN